MTKALILDLGYVCVYPAHGHWRIPANYAEVLGSQANSVFTPAFATACSDFAGMMDESIFVPDEQTEYAMCHEFYTAVNLRMGWNLTGDAVQAMARSCVWDSSRYCFYSDVIPFLSRWHGKILLGVLSDAMPSVQRMMDNEGMTSYLDAVVISTEIGAQKPDKRMYAAIVDKLGVSPRHCVFVDDRPYNLRGAQDFGIRPIQMLRENLSPKSIWPGETIKNLSELDALL